MNFTEIVEAEGHLVDTQLLNRIFDCVTGSGSSFEVLNFELGRTQEERSRIRLRISSPSNVVLRETLVQLVELGVTELDPADALLRPAEADAVVPDDFYSTTNHRTEIRVGGSWLPVSRQRMDGVVVVALDKAECRKLRDVKRGEQIVCGVHGIRTILEHAPRESRGFVFMGNENSSERRTLVAVRNIAGRMRVLHDAGGRIVFVAGPVVVHTGGGPHLEDIIRMGYVSALLAGNALAVHDAEASLHGTSLGVDVEAGGPVEGGHRNHMRAINTINRHGGIAGAVKAGALKSGLMKACVECGVPFSLAGSIRDDGPLPDTQMDLIRAQADYAKLLEGAAMVVCLSSMLHSIGVGNMLPASVYMVCVDINPAVVTKLSDRGSHQTTGIVTEVGSFLQLLARELRKEGTG